MTKRVLVIEDEDSIREIIGACLRDLCAWDAVLACNGAVAIPLAVEQQPDVILLDISMPDLDGFQVFELLKQAPTTALIPVILLTAKVLPRDRDRFAEMGVQGVIAKPFNPMLICREISTLMQW